MMALPRVFLARHALRRTGEIVIGQVFLASGGVAQTLHAQQLTSNGTANITGNPDVKFSSMLSVNLLWRSAARREAENIQKFDQCQFRPYACRVASHREMT